MTGSKGRGTSFFHGKEDKMVALLKREVGGFLQRLGWRKEPDYKPRPQKEIDYDALFEDVSARYPKIMKQLAE